MRRSLAPMAVLVLLSPLAGYAQDGRAALESVAKAIGAGGVKSIQYTGSGVNFQVGQNYSPDVPWPRFIVKSYTRAVSYETAAIRDELVRTRGEDPPRGGGPITPGEQRQVLVTRGDFAWTVVGDAINPTPVALFERQLQLWTTPHGVIKMATANKATVQGSTISFTAPGLMRVRATVDSQNLIERIDAVMPNAVLGDMPVEIRYSDYNINHLAADDRPEEVRASFGENYGCLRALKAVYDPANLFRINANIAPA